MGKHEDLEKTQPIDVINDEIEILDENTRAKKYEDIMDEDDELVVLTEAEKVAMEEAEESLAERNIALAEELLADERAEKEALIENKIDKGKVSKWSTLSKKKKVLIIVGIVLLIFLIVGIILFLVFKNDKDEVKTEPKVEEVEPVIVDNFYYQDGKIYILDENEKELGSYKCNNKDEKLCYVAINNYREGYDVVKYLNKDETEKVERIPVYDNNYVFIYDNKSEDENYIVMYSLKDKKVKETYLDVKAYNDNYIIVKSNEKKYGLLQLSDGITEVIKPTYEYLGMISGQNNLVAKTSRGYIMIDKNNKNVSQVLTMGYDIKSYNDEVVIVADSENKYYVYDYKGNLITGDYKFITTYENYILLVDQYNKLTVRDSEGNKYVEEGFTLRNTDFVPSYIYGEDGKVIEKRLSFKPEIKDGVLVIATYSYTYLEDTYYNVSINEGVLSISLPYHNYFDGKLYFYVDEAKEELIGSYKCSNKNIISDKTTKLETCLPAKDTIFEDNDMQVANYAVRKSTIPIINKRYVFVSDGSSTVNLYDLVDNKNKAAYSSVNTYTEANDYTLTHKSGTFEIIGLNKKGKYGMIEITSDSLSGIYDFKYSKLEKIGDYVTGVLDGESILIFNKNSVSVTYPGVIKGYVNKGAYVKIKDGDKYYVYASSGKEVSKNSYKYVELYEEFYAGVDTNNKLKLYNYDGEEVISESVSLHSSTYCNTETPAFKVTYKNGKYEISVFKSNKYETQEYAEISIEDETPEDANNDEELESEE